jgi:hypothetical protein
LAIKFVKVAWANIWVPIFKGAVVGALRRALFFPDLEIHPLRIGGKELADPFDDPPGTGKTGHCQRRLRHPALRQRLR